MNLFKSPVIRDSVIFICLFSLFLWVGIARNVGGLQSVIWSDAEGYYMYLPAMFIQESIHNVPLRTMDYRKNDKGEIVMKYTCGVAYFFLPFFLVANSYAHIFHYNSSGFSTPYYYAIIVCGVFWAFIGLFLLRTLLLRFFSSKTTWITIICILLGTNLFHYVTRQMGMSHIYSFLLTSAILLVADDYYKKPTKGRIFLLAFLVGWHILVRPTNCIMIIALLLLGVTTRADLNERLGFLKTRLQDIALAIPFFLLPIVPQLLYWKEVLGKWVVYSYKGESFIYWNNPKILAVLFDPLNGWLLYSPVILFALLGLVIRRKDKRTNSIAVTTIFIIITYTFASWWSWNFGQAFGHRCYIEYLPLFAFPFAITIERILAIKKVYVKAAVFSLLLVTLYYSVALSFLNDTQFITKQWDWVGYNLLINHIY